MSVYRRLADDGRDQRRSIRDALEVLRTLPEYTKQSSAEIRVTGLHLPSDEIVGLVELEFQAHDCDTVYLVALSSAAQFRARDVGHAQYDCSDVSALDGALVDATGAVVLRDGRILHAVEVIPTRSLNQPTELDWRIVYHAISMIKDADKRCYRSLRDQDDLLPQLKEMTPDFRYLDCNAIHGLEVPGPKKIAYSLGKREPTLRKPSPQKVIDALRKFGMRIPHARPRRAGPSSATI